VWSGGLAAALYPTAAENSAIGVQNLSSVLPLFLKDKSHYSHLATRPSISPDIHVNLRNSFTIPGELDSHSVQENAQEIATEEVSEEEPF
jgi:hypothetical protein